MNKIIKMLCLVLSIFMMLALVACGPEEESSSSSESSEQSSSELPSETESETDEESSSNEEDDFREGENMNTELPGYTPPYPDDYTKKQ
ncbi:MAG: hypothetical protein IKA43_06560 [Clostridia bacterium]|nr:hypothetical protein [Clostridia bacterium]